MRSLPPFRGKGRIGELFQKALTNYNKVNECLVTFKMKKGSLMRVDLRSYTEKGAFWTGTFDSHIVLRLASCLRVGSVALDVGANIGFWSIPLGRRLLELQGKLFSLEPVPSNYARLVENISLNGLGGIVKPLNVALGEKEGFVELSMGSEDYIAITGNAVVIGGRVCGKATASARMAKLDDIAVEQSIAVCDLIKVDIEGGEYGFLKGGQSFLERIRPLVYLELNYYWMEQFGWSLNDLNQFASSIGYSVYREIKGNFFPAKKAGFGIENALMVPVGTHLEQTARRLLSLP